MSVHFCKEFCGVCFRCQVALACEDEHEKILESLSDEDVDSLTRPDPDDPHTFALDHKGRP